MNYIIGLTLIMLLIGTYAVLEQSNRLDKWSNWIDDKLFNPEYHNELINKMLDRKALNHYIRNFKSSNFVLTEKFKTDEANNIYNEFHMEIDELINSFNNKINKLF